MTYKFVEFFVCEAHKLPVFWLISPSRKIIKNSLIIESHLLGQFTTCLATVLLQNFFETLFVKFRRCSAARRIVHVFFEYCKPFLCLRFACDIFYVHAARFQEAAKAFWFWWKTDVEKIFTLPFVFLPLGFFILKTKK